MCRKGHWNGRLLVGPGFLLRLLFQSTKAPQKVTGGEEICPKTGLGYQMERWALSKIPRAFLGRTYSRFQDRISRISLSGLEGGCIFLCCEDGHNREGGIREGRGRPDRKMPACPLCAYIILTV